MKKIIIFFIKYYNKKNLHEILIFDFSFFLKKEKRKYEYFWKNDRKMLNCNKMVV